MVVNIRDEGDQSLAYFLETRRLIGVNKVGAMILDEYFNLNRTEPVVSEKVSKLFGIPLQQAAEDVNSFLLSIKEEMKPELFNNTEQLEMSAPIGVELEITTDCNLRCRHCLQSDYEPYFMPLNKAAWILQNLAKNGVFEVSIIGGEPFTHPDFCEILRTANDCGLAIGITSNGVLIDERHVEVLASTNALSIAISIDGFGDVHDHIRGKGVFSKVDRSIRSLINAGVEVEVMFTINSYNMSSYKEVLEYCKSLGIVCNFNLFKPFKESHKLLVPNPDKFFAMMIELFEMRKRQEFMIGMSNAAIVSKIMGLNVRDECRAGQSGLVIDAHCRMLTCPSLFYCGYYKETEFPLFDEDFIETWKKHPLFTSFKANGLSGCQARSMIFCGDVKASDPYDLAHFEKFVASK